MPDGTIATLGVVIDPSGAVSGAAAVKAAAGDMNVSLTQSITVIQNAGKQATAFGEAMKVASASINVVKGVFDAFSSGLSFVNGFVQQGAAVDTLRTKFAGLTGSYQQANDAMAQLRQFSTGNPVSFTGLAQSTLDLARMTSALGATGGGMQGVIDLSEKIASAAPENFQEATKAVGKFYEAIQTGERPEMPVRQLVQMGVVSGDLLVSLDKLNSKGSTTTQMWGAMTHALDLNAGNASRFASTYDGLTQELGNSVDLLKQAFGEPLAISLKQPVADLTKMLIAADGPAASFGKSLGDEVRLFYGLFKTGDLGAYLKGEFDAGMSYLHGKWEDFSSWAGGIFTRFVSDPFKEADFGGALDRTFANLTQYLKAGFDDGVSSFRAGFAVSVGFLDTSLTSLFNSLISHLPHIPGFGSGSTIPENGQDKKTLADYKQQYSVGNTPYPTDVWKPATDAVGNFGRALVGVTSTVSESGRFLGMMANPLTAGFGAAGLSTLTAAATSLNVSAQNLAGMIQATTSETFGRNMSGSVDTTDEGRMSAFNAHHGAWQGVDLTDPNLLGAAVSPQQASALTGIADGNKAIAAVLGQMLQIQFGDKTAQVRAVDIAPNSNQGIELTPAAHRAVGDNSGSAAISYGLASGSSMDAMRARGLAAGTFPTPDAGPGTLPNYDALAASISHATEELSHFGLTFQASKVSETDYNASLKDLNTLLGNNVISQGQYNSMLDKAQEKLYTSGAAYDVLKNSIGEAAAKQAELNANLAHMKTQVDLGTASPGQSLSYGAQSWSQAQGNPDQQYFKATGSALDDLTNRSTDMFSSMINGSQSASQAFRTFAAGMLDDIAKLILKMEIMKGMQMLLGSFGGGSSGGGFGGSGSSGISDGGGGFFSNDEVDDIIGAAGAGHSGAMISGLTTGNRIVDMRVFQGAPRLHSGGMLGYDEVPFVGLRGERVLNRQETAAYGRSGGGVVNNISVPIVDSGGNPSNASGLSASDFKAMQKQFQQIADDRIAKANRYRGINNPG